MSDVSSVFIWWFTIFIIGLIFLPLTARLFSKFIDRGYIFSKIIGILLSSYLIWLLGSFSLLPFSRLSIVIILLGYALVNIWIMKGIKKNSNPLKFPFSLIYLEEVLFILTLSFWSYVRATEPSIRGLEKFMDFGFVNSILRSNFFPPLDMWLAKSPEYTGGYHINYYYFGHYITAFLTKLSSINSAITYNLMIATLFSFTFTLPFSIGANLYYLFQSITGMKSAKSTTWSKNYKARDAHDSSCSHGASNIKLIIIGLLTAFLVALGGNLHTLYIFTSGYPNENPQPPWKLEFGFHPERYWYPNATRFIPFTIHEFPIYSFVVADLHGHVSDIPMVLLTIALLLTLVTEGRGEKEKDKFSLTSQNSEKKSSFLQEFKSHTSVSLPKLVLLGVLLATMYMTNAWDGIIYLLLSSLVFLYRNLILRKNAQKQKMPLSNAFYKTFSASLFLLFFFLAASLPFSLNFKPFVSGIGVLCAPSFLSGKNIGPFLFEAGKCQKSPWWMLVILWGFFYYNVLGFLTLVIIPFLRKKWKMINVKQHTDVFIILLIFISTLLLVFPEFFYIKDIYPAHYRANTMFKLGYQAFMLLGIASAYIFMRIKKEASKTLKFAIYSFIFTILFILVAIYPYFAINSYYGGLKTYRGLYGLNWLASQYPDDYQAILWLRKNIQCNQLRGGCNNQPVIVEANGDSYTDYARVSANTGLPTIVGWPVHEWLWRGSYDEAGKRIPEVAVIYESKDVKLTKEILRKYAVEYIFVGTLEREKYKNLNEEKLKSLGKVVFQNGNTKIYRLTLF